MSSVNLIAYKSNNAPDLHIFNYGALISATNILYFELVNPYHTVMNNTVIAGYEVKEYTLHVGKYSFKTISNICIV